MSKRYARIGFILCATFLFAACSTSNTTSIIASPVPTQITLSVTDTALPSPFPIPTVAATSTSAPLNLHPQVVVLAGNLPGPDDLLLAPDGSIYLSDVSDGTIKQYTSDGQLRVVLSGLNEPEGMAFLPDGSFIIAEQGLNRLTRYDFSSGNLKPFLSLENHTSNLGLDGILWTGSELIVPDSPNGSILSVSFDGLTVRQIATGLARPTGAWREADGSLLIADENGNALFRLHPDGALEKISAFSVPDDVIEDSSGNIFVATLGDNSIHILMTGTYQDAVLVSSLNSPQGIIFDSDGNLVVADAGHHQLIKLIIH